MLIIHFVFLIGLFGYSYSPYCPFKGLDKREGFCYSTDGRQADLPRSQWPADGQSCGGTARRTHTDR